MDDFSKSNNSESYNEHALDINNFEEALAPFWKRIIAWLIDQTVLIFLILFLLYFFLDFPKNFTNFLNIFPLSILLADVLSNLTYFTLLEGFSGQSLGKRFLGITVCREKGGKIGYLSAFIRRIGLIIPIFSLIDAIFIIFTSKNQRIFDKISSSLVIEKDFEKYFSDFSKSKNTKDKEIQTENRNLEIKRNRKMIENIKKSKDKLKERYKNGYLEEEQYKRLKNKYESRIKELERNSGNKNN